MSQITQEMQKKCRRFRRLYQKAEYSGSFGIYTIVVKEVLTVGEFWLNQPEVAIVEDLAGNLWRIPECDGLISRHDVKKGMSGEDVKLLQEILATDPEIYPEGLVNRIFWQIDRESGKKVSKNSWP